MQFRRNIQKDLEKQISTAEIVVLTGMRRTGKTTLLKMIFDKIDSENKVFLDLENILDQQIFEESDFNNIWSNLSTFGITQNKKSYVFIDEVQLMPSIVRIVKYLFDHYDVKFFLTGSSSFYLKNLFPESLAGRKNLFHLSPLTFNEFLIFKGHKVEYKTSFYEKDKVKNKIKHEKMTKLLDEYVNFGGFPQVVLENNTARKKDVLSDIFNSYFQHDVQILADFKKIDAFKKLLLLLSRRVGSKLDITKLASNVSVSRETVYNYLSFLENTFFIKLLSPFSQNIDREVSGAKKVYLCDTGILNLIGKTSEGSLFENAVLMNLIDYQNINYYQKRSGAEIDFLVNEVNTALEVKITGDSADLRKLKNNAAKIGFNNSFIITREFNSIEGIIPFEEL
jgi:predicted AAA+ superfamily ATPase